MRASAKRLLAHLHDKLVLDWRRKASTSADVNTTIRDVLDAELPADPYPPPVFEEKVQAVFDHILTAYEDRQINVYREDDAPPQERRERELEVAKDALGLSEPGSLLERERTTPGSLNLSSIVDQVVEAIRIDAEFASHVAAGMAVRQDSSLRTVAELIDNARTSPWSSSPPPGGTCERVSAARQLRMRS